ncbi:hypothetical protein RB195_017713 [Necator americanus]|uniref:Receptor L-domain domain-containing protein n=1 Tax=Necator americanus TaxID=51031 RepID=A0ABR1C9E7_NECAM
MKGCRIVNGGLIFQNLTEVTHDFSSLGEIRYINGSLRIENSPIFVVFNFLQNLKYIDNSEIGPGLSIQANPNLTYIKLPSLRSISSNDSIRVVIHDNPKLVVSGKLRKVLRKLPEDQIDFPADSQLARKIRQVENSTTTDTHNESSTNYTTDVPHPPPSNILEEMFPYLSINHLFMSVTAPIVILILALCGALLWALRRKKISLHRVHRNILPSPNYRLKPKAQVILLSLCQDILLINPLMWKFEERKYLWLQEQKENEKSEFLVKVHANYINNQMLPLATNGRLPTPTEGDTNASRNQFLIFDRVRTILKPKSVVVIGTGDDPKCVIFGIPTEVGKENVYEHGTSRIVLRLLRTEKAGNSVQSYEYSATFTSESGTAEKSSLKFVFFTWPSFGLVADLQEVLQLVQLCQNAKDSICVSDRHKEVFSLLHLFYSFVVVMETPISLNDAFQLHLVKCNGSMIDRIEMLFAMNFLLEWAIKAKVIPKELTTATTLWRSTYEQMAAFRQMHSNVMTIHPDHLDQISEEVVLEIARAGGFPTPFFSYREEALMIDKFVYRTHVAVEETDFEKKAREGQMRRLKISESEQKKKEKELEGNTTTVGIEQSQEDPLYVKKYRGRKMQELWEAEQKQIEELKRKREKKWTQTTTVQKLTTSTVLKGKIPPLQTSTSPTPTLATQESSRGALMVSSEGAGKASDTPTPLADKASPDQGLKEKKGFFRNAFLRISRFVARKGKGAAPILSGRQLQLQPPTAPTDLKVARSKKGSKMLSVKSKKSRRSTRSRMESSSGPKLHSPTPANKLPKDASTPSIMPINPWWMQSSMKRMDQRT